MADSAGAKLISARLAAEVAQRTAALRLRAACRMQRTFATMPTGPTASAQWTAQGQPRRGPRARAGSVAGHAPACCAMRPTPAQRSAAKHTLQLVAYKLLGDPTIKGCQSWQGHTYADECDGRAHMAARSHTQLHAVTCSYMQYFTAAPLGAGPDGRRASGLTKAHPSRAKTAYIGGMQNHLVSRTPRRPDLPSLRTAGAPGGAT
jgi:hypothetical protein